jgi:hypothetical protein
MRRGEWARRQPPGRASEAGRIATMRRAGYCPSGSKTSCRSLCSSVGSSKKTKSAGDDVVAGFRQTTQIAVSHHGFGAVTMAAAGSANGDSEIEQFQGTGGEEAGELHAASLSGMATPHLWRCHKLPVSTRRRHRCSTTRERTEEPLFNASLNNRIQRVEHPRPN